MNQKSSLTHPTRREFLRALGAGAAAMALPDWLLGSQAAAGGAPRPDIVLVLADDMGYSDIGCFGGEMRTPHIDALAQGGVRFTQFYNTARCCPTRASLLSGLYSHQAGVGLMTEDLGYDGYRGDLNSHCVTLAEAMRLAGYGTYMSGKWHVTKSLDVPTGNWPTQRGFDRFFGTINGSGSYYDPLTLTLDNTRIRAPEHGFYYTDAIADHAIQFIGEHCKAKADVPYFTYVAFTSPHWPLQAYEEDIALYKGRFDAGWDALREQRYHRMIEMGLIDPKWKLTERDPSVPAWTDEKNKDWQRRKMEVYAAQIDRMDRNVGRLVEAIRQTGRLDNTLIFFLSDNGGCDELPLQSWGGPKLTRDGRPVIYGARPDVMPGPETTFQGYQRPWANVSNSPFRLYKHYEHEGGISTPLIVHWPARVKGGGPMRRQVGHLIDIMATMVDVSGAKYPTEFRGEKIKPMEGRSLVPALDDKPIERSDAIYWEHEGNRAVRDGQWKLVAYGENGPWELYDMEADRTEMNDLSGKDPNRAKKMAGMWQGWAERANVLPLDPWRRQRPARATPTPTPTATPTR